MCFVSLFVREEEGGRGGVCAHAIALILCHYFSRRGGQCAPFDLRRSVQAFVSVALGGSCVLIC